MNVGELQPCPHDPPAGWDPQTFELLTDALARALVGASRRRVAEALAAEPPAGEAREGDEPGGASG